MSLRFSRFKLGQAARGTRRLPACATVALALSVLAQPLPRPSGLAAVPEEASFDTVPVTVVWNPAQNSGDYWHWIFESPVTNGSGFTTNNRIRLPFSVGATNVFMVRAEISATNTSAWSSADWLAYRTNVMTVLPGLERAAEPRGPWTTVTNSLPWVLSGPANIFVRPKFSASNWIAIRRLQ
jgi:hypothetical protein